MVSIRNPVAHGAAPDGLTIAALRLMDNLGLNDMYECQKKAGESKMKTIITVLLAAVVLGLSACGGGGTASAPLNSQPISYLTPVRVGEFIPINSTAREYDSSGIFTRETLHNS